MGTISLVDSFASATNASVYSKNCNLGAAASDRVIAVAVACRSGLTPTLSCTIAGSAAASSVTLLNQGTRVQIFELAVPTGTAADIVITSTVELVRLGFSVYTLTGVTPGAAVTRTVAGEGEVFTLSTNFNPASAGVGLGVVYAVRAAPIRFSTASSSAIASGSQTVQVSLNSTDSTSTWSGLSEDVDAFLEGGAGPHPQALALAVWYDAPSSIAGTLSSTLGTLTGTGTANLAIVGGASTALGALTLSATAQVRLLGALDITLSSVTSNATASLLLGGSASAILGVLRTDGNGKLAIAGSSSITLGELTGFGEGGGPDTNTGVIDGQLGAMQCTGAGALLIRGTVDALLGAVSVIASGAFRISLEVRASRTFTVQRGDRVFSVTAENRTFKVRG